MRRKVHADFSALDVNVKCLKDYFSEFTYDEEDDPTRTPEVAFIERIEERLDTTDHVEQRESFNASVNEPVSIDLYENEIERIESLMAALELGLAMLKDIKFTIHEEVY